MDYGPDLNNIDSNYKKTLGVLEPYLLTYPGNLTSFNINPFGLDIPTKNIFSCLNSKNAQFFDLLQTLDKLSFGPVGMPMEKWVFFDCGEMVGGIFGLALNSKNADKEVLKQYQLKSNFKGLIPVSMYIAIPMAKDGAWFGHNLCSANSFLGDKYPFNGLALLTKVLGVKTFNYSEHYGATQWESGALNIHLQMADMDIKSAYTPAHSFEKTITYKSIYTDEKLITALSGVKRQATSWDTMIDVKGKSFFKEMQEEIEHGSYYKIVGRPVYEDNKMHLPIIKGEK